MKRALIGYSGFVGSNLRGQSEFSDLFNSKNFEEMAGREFDEIVCAGISAVKWLANKEPENDWASIKPLLEVLGKVKASRFILISTIDVYPTPNHPSDESEALSAEEGQPYGQHRLKVEQFVERAFSSTLIARLPALFGPGLKKNALFDLMNGNQTDKINPSAAFQWYPVGRLSDDLITATQAGLSTVNLVTEPVRNSEIVESFFPNQQVGSATEPAPKYDLRSKYAGVYGGSDGYIMRRDSVLASIKSYVHPHKPGIGSIRG